MTAQNPRQPSGWFTPLVFATLIVAVFLLAIGFANVATVNASDESDELAAIVNDINADTQPGGAGISYDRMNLYIADIAAVGEGTESKACSAAAASLAGAVAMSYVGAMTSYTDMVGFSSYISNTYVIPSFTACAEEA